MGWRDLYKNNHYSGGMDFDYFPAVICNDKFLVKRLGELVDLYLRSEYDPCLKSFSERLIGGVLVYFSEHKWSREVNNALLLSNGFLSSCLKLDLIHENEQIINLARNLKEYSLQGALIKKISVVGTPQGDIVDLAFHECVSNGVENFEPLIKSLKLFREYAGDKHVREKLCGIKSFLISCVNMLDTLKNQEIRKCAKYLLINFVDEYITEDIILEVKTLVLER